MRCVTILGGGPAGSSAAIAALRAGLAVDLVEKSHFPRHKVCGEFFSPEIAPVLDTLGVWQDFQARKPASIERLGLHFGSTEKWSRLPEPAYGLSRYKFDHLLFERARAQGAVTLETHTGTRHSTIVARGRQDRADRGSRLFGFKAHFDGPASTAIELFFFGSCYVGVNQVEGGVTNVCGLAPEHVLRGKGFDIDAVVHSCDALSQRLRPMQRRMKWLTTGPLVFRGAGSRTENPGEYPAGDALSFVDPFTGTGLLNAVITGTLAARAVAEGTPPAEHLVRCRTVLTTAFHLSSTFRSLLGTAWAEHLTRIVPGRWLFAMTRPRVTGLDWH